MAFEFGMFHEFQRTAGASDEQAFATSFEQEAERLMTLVRVFQLVEPDGGTKSKSSASANLPVAQPAPDRASDAKLRLVSRA